MVSSFLVHARRPDTWIPALAGTSARACVQRYGLGRFGCRCLCPEVDPRFGGVFIDTGQFFRGEIQIGDGINILIELGHTGRPNEGAGYLRVSDGPRDCHLGKGLVPFLGKGIKGTDLGEAFCSQMALIQGFVRGKAAVLRDTVEVSAGQEALGER